MEIGLDQLTDAGLAAYAEESRQFNAAAKPVAGPRTPEELQQVRDKQSALLIQSGSRAVERIVEADGRRVPVRITVPEGTSVRGACLYIHGGGFYIGLGAGGDERNARLADALGAVVVSVDYRLAPEDPWPAAPDDCETAARWLLEQGESLYGATELVIGGSSAGANLALVTLLRLREQGLSERFAGAALQFGAYDLSGQTPGGRLYADEYFIQTYVGHVTDRTHSEISPLYADLRGLPPTLLIVGDSDILLEDNLAMAARLSAAGNAVDLRVYPESRHNFTASPTTMATTANRDIETWLADRISAR
ncbi:alpha/beta hydrolase [Nocardia sp. NBC_01499]|uniref:alpha/beta hydrolase n=1 Tax=Nocardia sp. NBC_01499 TaxID=2903597 RepID=UPI00386F0F8C